MLVNNIRNTEFTKMTIQRREAPTLESVVQKIADFEHRYRIETAVFTLNDHRSNHVDEDDAMEWLYLIEQVCALADSAVGSLYATASVGRLLDNVEDSSELLVA